MDCDSLEPINSARQVSSSTANAHEESNSLWKGNVGYRDKQPLGRGERVETWNALYVGLVFRVIHCTLKLSAFRQSCEY